MFALPDSATLKLESVLLMRTLIYGAFFVLLKLFIAEVGAIESALLRLIFAGGLALVLELAFLKTKIRGQGDWLRLLFLAIFGVFWIQFFASIAAPMTSAFHATLIMGSIPLQTVLLSALLGYEALNRFKAVGLGLGIFGVYFLIQASGVSKSLPETFLTGDVLILFNAFLFSCGVLVSKDLLSRYAPLGILTLSTILAGFFALGISVFKPLPLFPSLSDLGSLLGQLSPLAWALFIYIIVFASIVGYWMSNYALSKSSPSKTVSYLFIEPFWAAILGSFLLEEAFTLPMALASIIIFAGVYLVSKKNISAVSNVVSKEQLG